MVILNSLLDARRGQKGVDTDGGAKLILKHKGA